MRMKRFIITKIHKKSLTKKTQPRSVPLIEASPILNHSRIRSLSSLKCFELHSDTTKQTELDTRRSQVQQMAFCRLPRRIISPVFFLHCLCEAFIATHTISSTSFCDIKRLVRTFNQINRSVHFSDGNKCVHPCTNGYYPWLITSVRYRKLRNCTTNILGNHFRTINVRCRKNDCKFLATVTGNQISCTALARSGRLAYFLRHSSPAACP